MLYPDESYQIMGACFEVHNRKGCGFLEPVYQECLETELEYLKIPCVSQPEMQLTYRERILQQTYKPDFVCYDKVLVEIKAVDQLIDKKISRCREVNSEDLNARPLVVKLRDGVARLLKPYL